MTVKEELIRKIRFNLDRVEKRLDEALESNSVLRSGYFISEAYGFLEKAQKDSKKLKKEME